MLLQLPLIDLSSPDRASAAKSVRQACVEHGFFYVTNHGVEDETLQRMFRESKKFFSLPLAHKMKLEHNKHHRGYTPMYSETLDTSSEIKGDTKESFNIGPMEGINSEFSVNQWPLDGDTKESFNIGPMEGINSEFSVNQWPLDESLPLWRVTMESYYKQVLSVGKRIVALIALALNLDEQYFEKIGALHEPMGFVRLLHYPGELDASKDGRFGASAHSDYGMITLLITDGVPGLQICRDKDNHPQLWEDVTHVHGAFIVNVGDMLERWTNCLFRSTLHRVVTFGQERYSVAFFLDPNADCLVECLESCCSETSPARFPPVRSFDYLMERLRVTYSS